MRGSPQMLRLSRFPTSTSIIIFVSVRRRSMKHLRVPWKGISNFTANIWRRTSPIMGEVTTEVPSFGKAKQSLGIPRCSLRVVLPRLACQTTAGIGSRFMILMPSTRGPTVTFGGHFKAVLDIPTNLFFILSESSRPHSSLRQKFWRVGCRRIICWSSSRMRPI